MTTRSRRSSTGAKVGAYFALSAFGLLMLMPFLFMLANSLKDGSSIFTDPNSLIPHRNLTTGGEDPRPLYVVDVDGREVNMALVKSGIQIGRYAPATDISQVVERRENEIEKVGGFTKPKKATVNGVEYNVFLVTPEGGSQPVEMVELSRTALGLLHDPAGVVPDQERVVGTLAPVQKVSPAWSNFGREDGVLGTQNLDQSLSNTALVTILVVIGTVLTSILGGYAFSRLQWKGRDSIFLVYLGSLMIPFVLLIIPLFKLMVTLGWNDHLSSLVVPFLFSAYGTFLMRQFFVSIPKDLDEAATIDGATPFQILFRILVPLSWPAIATLATFTFLYAWNSYVWPLVAVSSNEKRHVLSISLSQLGGRAAEKPHLVLAGVAIAVSVPVAVFVFAQRYFVENQASSGVK